jgi:hypothetical protein
MSIRLDSVSGPGGETLDAKPYPSEWYRFDRIQIHNTAVLIIYRFIKKSNVVDQDPHLFWSAGSEKNAQLLHWIKHFFNF